MESGEMELLSKQAILSLPRDVEKSLDGKILDEYINVKDIEALPTVQSQSTAGQLNDSAQSTNLIDRQQAIDAIHCNIVVTGRENAELVAKTIGEFVDRIKALPTIQPVATDTNVGDKIYRREAIDAINTWPKFGVDGNGHIVSWNEGLVPYVHLEDVMQAIENMPSAQPEPHWIPCSERLPETGVEVLTYDEALNYIEIQTVSDGRWENQRGDWQDLDDIAAWMPLPEAYKEGGERI